MSQNPTQPKYLDPGLSIAERVADLLASMTLEEKVSQMNHPAQGVPRLGIPAYNFWSEALHGVARNGRATVFPEPIGLAATWNKGLIRQMASATGDEARAKYHETLRVKGHTDIYQGLTFWSPNVNLFRDPRWGRGQETWGEDPFLSGEMGSAFVRGMQGDDPRYLKTAACAKHYAVHSGPEKLRHTFNAIVSRRELYDSYLPAFQKLVMQAKVEAVMGAYNRTLDEACCASRLLLTEILREEWGFDGHVVSDCGALTDIHQHHHLTQDAAESAALAIRNGCDIGCDHVYDAIPEAIGRGLMSEADLDLALGRTLTTRFRLGMFDPQEQVPYASTPMSVVGCSEHVALAYETAAQSVVLLKNQNHILPLKSNLNSALVVGPTATSLEALLGNYHGFNLGMTSLLEGIIGRLPEGVRLEYRPGCMLMHPNQNQLDWSVYEAANVDVVIACMGLTPHMEGEEGDAILTRENGDRSEIELPAVQVEYLKKLASSGGHIVLVLTGGSPIALGELVDMVDAVVFVWYPGQEGGKAVADVLFGKRAPSGKLPITFPKSTAQLPPFDDYSMDQRTYRYAAWEPQFPFGFGLSYTCFAYSDLELEETHLPVGEALRGSFRLENRGMVAAAEVAQIYLSVESAPFKTPLYGLVGFEKVWLEPGEVKTVSFEIAAADLGVVDEAGVRRQVEGAHLLTVGGCSPGKRGLELGAPRPVEEGFTIII